jgi:hypothetical protein
MIVGVAILLFYSATWRAEKKEKQAARADLFGLIPDLDPCLPRLYYCGEKFRSAPRVAIAIMEGWFTVCVDLSILRLLIIRSRGFRHKTLSSDLAVVISDEFLMPLVVKLTVMRHAYSSSSLTCSFVGGVLCRSKCVFHQYNSIVRDSSVVMVESIYTECHDSI